MTFVLYGSHVATARHPRLPRPRADDRLHAPAALRGLRRLVLDGDAEPDLPGAPRARGRGSHQRRGRSSGRQAGEEALRAHAVGATDPAELARGADGALAAP